MPDKFNPKVSVGEAIRSLHPTAQFVSSSEGVIRWDSEDISQPSKADIDAETIKVQASYDALDYARKRQAEYPDYGTQLNKIYDDGLTKWKSEMVDPIKAKYPKP